MLELSPESGIEYRIAESYDASDDAKTWTFKIRNGVSFQRQERPPKTCSQRSSAIRGRGVEAPAPSASSSGIKSMRTEGRRRLCRPVAGRSRTPTCPILLSRLSPDRSSPTAARMRSARRPYRRRPLQGGLSSAEPGVRLVAASSFPNFWNADEYWATPRPGRGHRSSTTPPRAYGRRCSRARCNMMHPRRRPRWRRSRRAACRASRSTTVPGQWPLRVHHALQYRAVRQRRLAYGFEVGDEPGGNGRQDPARLRIGW